LAYTTFSSCSCPPTLGFTACTSSTRVASLPAYFLTLVVLVENPSLYVFRTSPRDRVKSLRLYESDASKAFNKTMPLDEILPSYIIGDVYMAPDGSAKDHTYLNLIYDWGVTEQQALTRMFSFLQQSARRASLVVRRNLQAESSAYPTGCTITHSSLHVQIWILSPPF
jgi:hypothetical protein